MPFTPAHTAIVLPFLKIDSRYVSATGLITGCVAPDFEYFLKFSVESIYSHTLWGIIYFNIPVSVFLAIVFHQVIKENLIANLPFFFQIRFQNMLATPFIEYIRKHPLVFVMSAAAGAWSHIFWDSFTHADGFFVLRLSFYNNAFVPFGGVNYPLWYALQTMSTFVGLFILVVYIIFMKPQPGVIFKPVLAYWLWLVVIAGIIVMVRFVVKSSDYHLGNLIVTCIAAICLSSIICGLIKFRRTIMFAERM
jgi:hypothetical protein